MKKKHLYYTILTIAFIVLFVFDVLILGALNVKSQLFIGLGVALVITLFGIFKSILKEHPYFKDIKGESESNGLDKEVPTNDVVNIPQVDEQEMSVVCPEKNPQTQKDDTKNIECLTRNTPSLATAKPVADNQRIKHRNESLKYLLQIVLYVIATASLCVSVYSLLQNNPNRLKYIKLVQSHQYDSIAKFYIEPDLYNLYFGQLIYEDNNNNFANQLGEFLIGYQGSGNESIKTDRLIRWKTWTYYDPYFRRQSKASEPVYESLSAKWKYNTSLSVYKQNGIGIISNEINKPHQYCKEMITALLDSVGLTSSPLSSKDGIRVEYQDSSISTVYIESIFFANDNIYELSTSWLHQEKWKKSRLSNDVIDRMRNTHQVILDSIKATKWKGKINDANLRIIPFFVSFIILFLFIIGLSLYRGLAIKRAKEAKLSIYGAVLSLVNLTLLSAQYYCIYSGSIIQNNNTISYLYIFACTFAFMNIPMLMFISKKVDENDQYDYLLPPWVKSYVNEKCKSTVEYKSFISCEVYPFFVLGNFPFGIVVLLFWIPLGIIQIVVFELRGWILWLSVDEAEDHSRNKANGRKRNTVIITMLLFIVLIILSLCFGWITELAGVMGLSF